MRKITRLTRILTFLLLTFSTLQVKADSWIDPNWEEMIEYSDVIALVQYTSFGTFRAKAKVLTLYKGQLSAKRIWISGFSNRYGPLDILRPGAKYIVFLNLSKPTEEALENLSDEIKGKPGYFKALQSGKAYYVWSPTSGDLKVRGRRVKYDLLQTTYYRNQSFHPLKEFEEFLKATMHKDKDEFHKHTLGKVKNDASNENSAKYLMMLYLSSFQEYDSIFQNVADTKLPESNYSLAKLLGQIEGEKPRDLLVKLLDNENSIVQGEAVRQLSNQDVEFIGPILLDHLNTSGEGDLYPTNFMDPVMNRIDGGKIEIIKTLGKLKYEPATKVLLPLLMTEDDYLFELVIEVLDSIGSKDYVDSINEHLNKGTRSLIFSISMIIAKMDLEECRSSLMNFISNHNRNEHPGFDYTISSCCGLAHFNDQETVDFLIADLEKFMTYKDTIKSLKQSHWFGKYIEAFATLEAEEARPIIYEIMFDWLGFNMDFIKFPKLFEIKKSLEDSLMQDFTIILPKEYKINKVLAFITNTERVIGGGAPTADFLIEITVPTVENGQEHIKKISEKLLIPIERIFIKSKKGIYYIENQARFYDRTVLVPLYEFYQYALAVPNQDDIIFLKGVENSNIITSEFDQKQLRKRIVEIEKKL